MRIIIDLSISALICKRYNLTTGPYWQKLVTQTRLIQGRYEHDFCTILTFGRDFI